MRAYLIEEQSRSNELATPIVDFRPLNPVARCLLSNRGLFPEQAIQEARADYRPFTWVDTQDICYGPLHITQCARQDVIVMEVPIRWKTLP